MVSSFMKASLLASPFAALASPLAGAPYVDQLHGDVKMRLYSPPVGPHVEHPISPPEHTIELKRSDGGIRSQAVALMRRATYSQATVAMGNADGIAWTLPITWAGQTFNAVLDTGSSDTWIVSTNFQCVDGNKNPQPQSYCHFQTGFSGDLATYKGETLNISYVDGEFVNGRFGSIAMTIGNVTVQQQQVAIADQANFFGTDTYAGLTGFAYPPLTRAYTTSGALDTYNPWITNARAQGSIGPAIGVALQRGNGLLGFNGQPSGIKGTVTGYATTALQVYSAVDNTQKTFYAITATLVYRQSPAASSQNNQYIIDTGSLFNYFPSSMAASINALYNPPATMDSGYYTTDCSATPPVVGVTFGGRQVNMYAQDMISTYQINGKCITTVQPAGSLNILGDAYLKSVVAIFDIGNNRFQAAFHNYT